jgi:hypothetical protein
MKTLFWVWFSVASIVTVVVIGKEFAWEMRDVVRPDAEGIAKKLEYAIQGRNKETVSQHTFSTEITGDSDILRITDRNLGITPELSVDLGGTISITALPADLSPDTANLEAFTILCTAAADYRLGHRSETFDTWIADVVAGSEATMFHDDKLTAIADLKEHAVTVTIFTR